MKKRLGGDQRQIVYETELVYRRVTPQLENSLLLLKKYHIMKRDCPHDLEYL